MRTDSQTYKILKWMRENGPITPLDALSRFGCMRLAARIKDLRDKGYSIITEEQIHKKDDGTRVSYAAYRLEEQEDG